MLGEGKKKKKENGKKKPTKQGFSCLLLMKRILIGEF